MPISRANDFNRLNAEVAEPKLPSQKRPLSFVIYLSAMRRRIQLPHLRSHNKSHTLACRCRTGSLAATAALEKVCGGAAKPMRRAHRKEAQTSQRGARCLFNPNCGRGIDTGPHRGDVASSTDDARHAAKPAHLRRSTLMRGHGCCNSCRTRAPRHTKAFSNVVCDARKVIAIIAIQERARATSSLNFMLIQSGRLKRIG